MRLIHNLLDLSLSHVDYCFTIFVVVELDAKITAFSIMIDKWKIPYLEYHVYRFWTAIQSSMPQNWGYG